MNWATVSDMGAPYPLHSRDRGATVSKPPYDVERCSEMAPPTTAWWQRGAIYQIYPRSFADSSGDGIGDLRGIAEHLDHLEALGVEAAWLSPFYRSPMADFGYDVADYRDVDPLFGTLADFDDLLARAH